MNDSDDNDEFIVKQFIFTYTFIYIFLYFY